MRVVLDTNVIVSGLLTSDGPCARIVDLLAEGAFVICADDRILDEYGDVLRRPELMIRPADADALLDLIRRAALPVAALPLDITLPDEDDMSFLEVAAAAQAILVTGNDRHFPKRARSGVAVLRPREFLELIRRAE